MKCGVDTSEKRFLRDELVTLCANHNVATTVENVKVRKGWCNSPKGMLQILFEKGYINKDFVTSPRNSKYSIHGKKDDFVVLFFCDWSD